MVTLRIDNRDVEVDEGSTILHAARKLGLDIPALCHRDGCTPNTSCLACVVRVNGGARLVPSCATRVAPGMNVESETPAVHDARRTALELLLADHAGDCQAPCQSVCPAHMDIPTMIRQITAGDLAGAIVTVKHKIALPATLGRICPELCEKGCRRHAKDDAVSICRLKRHVADADLASPTPYLPVCAPPSGKRVAVVGTGPAGLAAAWYLRQHGHDCVLIDDHEVAGGNLQYAVPEDLLPRDIVAAEVALVARLGATFRLGVRIGADVTLAALREEFDAVLLAVGEMTAAKAGALGVAAAPKGIKTDKGTMQTSVAGVFAAGAAVTPYRHAVRAVAEGREAATIIDQFVRGMKIAHAHAAFTVRLGVLRGDELTTFQAGASEAPRAAASPAHAALGDDLARVESDRCLRCDCAKYEGCGLRKYAAAYDASPTRFKMERRPFERVGGAGDLVIYEPGKCIQCGLCVQIAERAREPLGLTFVGRGFQIRVQAPLGGTLSEALRTVAGECAAACPTAAITLAAGRHPCP